MPAINLDKWNEFVRRRKEFILLARDTKRFFYSKIKMLITRTEWTHEFCGKKYVMHKWDGYKFRSPNRLKYSPVNLWSSNRKELWLTVKEFGCYNVPTKKIPWRLCYGFFFFVVGATKFKTGPKRPERRQWRLCGVFIVDFDHISHLSSASITDLEKVNVLDNSILKNNLQPLQRNIDCNYMYVLFQR